MTDQTINCDDDGALAIVIFTDYVWYFGTQGLKNLPPLCRNISSLDNIVFGYLYYHFLLKKQKCCSPPLNTRSGSKHFTLGLQNPWTQLVWLGRVVSNSTAAHWNPSQSVHDATEKYWRDIVENPVGRFGLPKNNIFSFKGFLPGGERSAQRGVPPLGNSQLIW